MSDKEMDFATTGYRGQVLVLVALMMTVLIGIAGLAVDVSGAYLAARYQRGVADAAALAGAQDLQTAGSRAIPPNGYTNARGHAMDLLRTQLGATGVPSCPTTSDMVNCQLPGTDYYVSIKTPSWSCAICDPTRSVQVTIRRPRFGLALARIFGMLSWNVSITSVAGVNFAASYGVVTLRPPAPTNKNDPSCAPYCDQNYDDIKLSNSVLNIFNSDIGTNSNMAPTNASVVNLQPGYRVYRYDQYQYWTGAPPSTALTNWIPDPNYSYPSRSGVPSYTGTTGVEPDAATCLAQQAKVPATYGLTVGNPTIKCYRPGIYADNGNEKGQLIVGSNTDIALLEPGVYFLDKGADISGTLIGGYEPGHAGVALVMPECGTAACEFAGNNAVLIALNMGSQYKNAGGILANAAQPVTGGPVETTGDRPILMTLLVAKDNPNLCYPADRIPVACNGSVENGHETLVLPGNGNLFLAGVQYAPSDNVTVNGNNSNTNGQLGQIVAWTITYTGGAVMNQVGAIAEGNGVLRLDSVCSDAQKVGCNNPEATAAIP